MKPIQTYINTHKHTRTIMNYQSAKWKKKREHILKRDKHIDKYLARYGITHEANLVHHIYPSELYPEFEWEDWNLISVCEQTHKRLHRTDGSLSKKGYELLKETKPNGQTISGTTFRTVKGTHNQRNNSN